MNFTFSKKGCLTGAPLFEIPTPQKHELLIRASAQPIYAIRHVDGHLSRDRFKPLLEVAQKVCLFFSLSLNLTDFSLFVVQDIPQYPHLVTEHGLLCDVCNLFRARLGGDSHEIKPFDVMFERRGFSLVLNAKRQETVASPPNGYVFETNCTRTEANCETPNGLNNMLLLVYFNTSFILTFTSFS